MTQLIIYILSIVVFGLFSYSIGKWLFCFVVQKKATDILKGKYFPDNSNVKEEFISKLNIITNNKYSKKELTDYYLKIRGLQNFNKDAKNSFWVRLYLRKQPFIKLNYYEQQSFFNEIIKEYNDNIVIPQNDRKSTFPRPESGVFAY